jgi:hypothetical protein
MKEAREEGRRRERKKKESNAPRPTPPAQVARFFEMYSGSFILAEMSLFG